MRAISEHDRVVTEGSIRDRSARVDYYTTFPSPTQWVAIGVLLWDEEDEQVRRPRRMLVGKGRNEASAVEDLRSRLARISRSQETEDAGKVAMLSTTVESREQLFATSVSASMPPDAEPSPDTESPTA